MSQRIELYSTELISISVPKTPLNCQLDGGHLVVEPHRNITDRVDCTEQEAIELMAASMLAAKAMYSVLGVEKVNYQEMGNWSLDTVQGAKLHIHIFGRHEQQRYQQRGASIRFLPANHLIYSQVYQSFNPTQISALSSAMLSIVKREPLSLLFSR